MGLKKWAQYIGIVCVVLGMLLSVTGCMFSGYAIGAGTVSPPDILQKQTEATTRIGFCYKDSGKNTIDLLCEAMEFAQPQTQYTRYRASMLHDTLTTDEQTVYHALEYAMENGYTQVMVDGRLLQSEEDLQKILEALALDSPLLEQNLRYSTGWFSHKKALELIASPDVTYTFGGYYVDVKNFDPVYWEKKLLALAEAEKVVSALPKGLTDIEKADRLYRYVADKVTYQDYDKAAVDTVQTYLYDALVTGKTHCDGYANALSLLFRLAGLNCVEKMYTAPAADELGHTWNMVSLKGKWYNVDGTGEDMIPEKSSAMGAGFHFAFADMFQAYTPDYASLYPACETGFYMQADAYLPSEQAYNFVSVIQKAYKNNGREWALIVLESYNDDKAEDKMQEIANYFRTSIGWVYTHMADGRIALLVFDGDLY